MERLRAVTYNRCSTEEESQKDALVTQVKESKESILQQGWILVDTYVEAKSGTTVKGRYEYNRLYQDLETDRFDVIVIKSQDRLMRNTRDWYLFLDRMQKNRKRLYMYLERKFYAPEDALITGIKAILAEEYSRELSKKINLAHKNRQREGKRFVFTNQTYGYRKLPGGEIAVDEREAEMIRMIYELSACGYGTHRSAQILWRSGYRNRKGKMMSPSLIRNIIRNPLYKGTAVLNRRHYDFESKQFIRNPCTAWIIHEHALPAIIEDDLFERANRGLDLRKQEKNREESASGCGNPGRYGLTGKLWCGSCGSPFYRTVRRNKSGTVAEWKCSNYLHNGRIKQQKAGAQESDARQASTAAAGCNNIHIDESRLYEAIGHLCRRQDGASLPEETDLIKKILSLLREAFTETVSCSRKEELKNSLEKLSRQKMCLLEKLLDGIVSDDDYRKKERELQDRMEQLELALADDPEAHPPDAAQEGRTGAGTEDREEGGMECRRECRIEAIRQKLEQGLLIQAQTVNRLKEIRKIEVFADHLVVCFESGAELTLPQTCSTSRRPVIAAQKEQILELTARRPQITAGEIAGELEINLSAVHRRIRELKTEGRLGYSTADGGEKWTRKWIADKEFLDFSD